MELPDDDKKEVTKELLRQFARAGYQATLLVEVWSTAGNKEQADHWAKEAARNLEAIKFLETKLGGAS